MALRTKQTHVDENEINQDCLRNMLMCYCCFVKWNKNVTSCQKTLFIFKVGLHVFSTWGAIKNALIVQSGV